MFYVYILELANRQRYTGFTADLKRRVKEHKYGKVSFTAKRLPVKLIHYEAYLMESDARRREKFLKSSEGKKMLKKQIRDLVISFFRHFSMNNNQGNIGVLKTFFFFSLI